jgi:hypothetical protein
MYPSFLSALPIRSKNWRVSKLVKDASKKVFLSLTKFKKKSCDTL